MAIVRTDENNRQANFYAKNQQRNEEAVKNLEAIASQYAFNIPNSDELLGFKPAMKMRPFDMQQPASDIGPAVQQPASPVQIPQGPDAGFGAMAAESYQQDQQNPQINSVYDIFSQIKKATPATIDPGQAPVYSEAQRKQYEKQMKIAALAQGLQGLFGTIASAQGKDFAYADDVLGAQAINGLKNLDANYFKELADYNDRYLKANLYNTGAQNQADEQYNQDYNRLVAIQQDDENRRKQLQEANDLQIARDKQNFTNEKEIAKIRSSGGGEGKSKNLLTPEQRPIFDGYVNSEIQSRTSKLNQAIQNGADPEEINTLREEIKELKGIKDYDLDNPVVSRTFGNALGWDASQKNLMKLQEQLNGDLDLVRGGKKDPQEFFYTLKSFYRQSGDDDARAQSRATEAMKQAGINFGPGPGAREELDKEFEQINAMPDGIAKLAAQREYESKSKAVSGAELQNKVARDTDSKIASAAKILNVPAETLRQLSSKDQKQQAQELITMLDSKSKELERMIEQDSNKIQVSRSGSPDSRKMQASELRKAKNDLEATLRYMK